MFNEELLQFIRAQRSAGMGDAELERLLIAEGDWDHADVVQAFSALGTPATPPVTPTPAPISFSAPIQAPTPVPPLTPAPIPPAPTPTPTPTPASVPAPSTPVVQAPPSQVAPPAPVPTPKITPPTFSSGGAFVPGVMSTPAPTPLINTKKEGWSLENLVAGKSGGQISNPPVIPSTPSQPPPPVIPPVTASTPIKFNISALHAEILSNKTAPAVSQESKKNDVRTPLPSFGAAPRQEEKRKSELSGIRSMASDLLAQGVGATAPSTTGQTDGKLNNTGRIEDALRSPTTTRLATSPFDDELARKNKIKRILEIVIGAVLVLSAVGGGLFIYMKQGTPDRSAVLGTALTKFFATPSFSYQGKTTTDLTLSVPGDDTSKNGMIKVSLEYSGSLTNGLNGYGDGVHQIVFAGGWQMPGSTTTVSTEFESDVRVIESALYYRVTALPETTDLDLEFFKANWVKIDFNEIAAFIGVPGITSGAEEYGSFGGTSGVNSFNTLLQKASPFKAVGEMTEEVVDGLATIRIPVSVDPELMTNFVQSLYRKYANKDLQLSSDERVRFKGAMAKILGNVWVDAQTGALKKISLSANFDDDIGETHVTGPVSIEFSFAPSRISSAVEIPSGVLTREELEVKIDEYRWITELRLRDQPKIDRVALLTDALKSYLLEKGRYPKEISDLYEAGKLDTVSFETSALKEYFYKSYQKAGSYTKATQCTTTGKVCAFYHLGTDLDDVENPVLENDADIKTAFLGLDSAGCGGEKERSCYDVVSPEASIAPPLVTPPSTDGSISPPPTTSVVPPPTL